MSEKLRKNIEKFLGHNLSIDLAYYCLLESTNELIKEGAIILSKGKQMNLENFGDCNEEFSS